AEAPEPPEPLRRLEGRADDLADEDFARGLDGGELQLLLRAEVREESALAHRQLRGETPDGQTFKALLRRDVDGGFENGLPRALAVRPPRPGRRPLCRRFNRNRHRAQYSTNVRFEEERL